MKGYSYNKYSFRASTDFRPAKWISIRPTITGSKRKINDRQRSVTDMYSKMPWDSPYLEDGSLLPHRYSGWWNASATNNLLDLSYGNYGQNQNYGFNGNFDFDIYITDRLTFQSVNAYRYNTYRYHGYTDPRSSSGEGVQGRISENSQSWTRKSTNQKFLINKTFGDKHKLNGLIAYEYRDYTYKLDRGRRHRLHPRLPDPLRNRQARNCRRLHQPGGSQLLLHQVELHVRQQVPPRRIVPPRRRLQPRPALGQPLECQRRLGNEPREPVYRTVGRLLQAPRFLRLCRQPPHQPLSRYDLYSVGVKYDGAAGALISVIGNKDLTWERTFTFDVGFDANFFNERLRTSFDFYIKNTDNILYNVPVTGLVGVTSIYRNVGKMRNTGVELNIGGDIITTQDRTWTMDLNLAHNANELRDLYPQSNGDGTSSVRPVIIGDGTGIAGSISRILEVGEPIDTYYGREWGGVDPEDGTPMWYMTDENGNRVLTHKYAEADEVKLGTFNPKVFGALNTSLRWKALDLNASFGFSIGGKIYNYSRAEYDSDGAYTDRNRMKLQDGWTRWEKPGDIATHPPRSLQQHRPGQQGFEPLSRKQRLPQAPLAHPRLLDPHSPDWGIRNLRVSLSAENLFCITKYSGVDPELPASGGSVMGSTGPGVYPSVRRFSLGLNLSF